MGEAVIWTDENAAELVRLSRLGHGPTTIGKMMGISKNSVIGKLSRLKIDKEGNPTNLVHLSRVRWTPDLLKKLEGLCGKNLTVSEIAAEMDMDYKQVMDCIKYRKLPWIRARKTPAQSATEVFLPYPAWRKWNQQRRAQNAERV